MSDELTTAVAVLGAATGVGSLVVQGVMAHRDRPRLRLRAEVKTLYGKPPRVVIDVLNDSPRAATIREVGLYALPVRIEIRPGEDEPRPGLAEVDYIFSKGPDFIEAGDTRQFAGFPDVFDQGIHADQPLRLYVIDARNRRVWGSAAPYVRLALGEHPPVEDTDSEGIKSGLRPDGMVRAPWPVEPYWKLWKSRQLRRTTKESRAAARQQKKVGTIRLRGYVKRFDPDEAPAPRDP